MSTFSEFAEMGVVRGESPTPCGLDYGAPMDTAARMAYISGTTYEFDSMPPTPATSRFAAFETPIARSQFGGLRLSNTSQSSSSKPLSLEEHAVPSTPASPLPQNPRLSNSTLTSNMAIGSPGVSSRYHPYHPRLPYIAEANPETVPRHQSPSWSSSHESPFNSGSNNEALPSQSSNLNRPAPFKHSQLEHRRIQPATSPASLDPFAFATPTGSIPETRQEIRSQFPRLDPSLTASANSDSWLEDQDPAPQHPGAAALRDQDSPRVASPEQHRTQRLSTHRTPIGNVLVFSANDLRFSYVPGGGYHLIIEPPPPCQACGHPPTSNSPLHRQHYFASSSYTSSPPTQPDLAMADEEAPTRATRSSKAARKSTQATRVVGSTATQKAAQASASTSAAAKSQRASASSAQAKAKQAPEPSNSEENSLHVARGPAKRATTKKRDVALSHSTGPGNDEEGGAVIADGTGSTGQAPKKKAKGPSKSVTTKKQATAQRDFATSGNVEDGNDVTAGGTGSTGQAPKKKAKGPPKSATREKQVTAQRDSATSADVEEGDGVTADGTGGTGQAPKKKAKGPVKSATSKKSIAAQRNSTTSGDVEERDVVMADGTGGTGTGQAPKKKANGRPKHVTSKKQVVARPDPVNSQDAEDSDIVMANETGTHVAKKKATQPGTATSLKRKSSVRSLSGTAAIADDEPSDPTPSTDGPRAKKSKSNSTSMSRSAALAILDDAPPAKPPKKGGAQPKNAVVTAQKALLEKENESLRAELAAEKAENQRLRHVNDQSQQDLASRNKLIPRPPGERGKDGWNLQVNMGLANRYDLYTNIRRAVRYAVVESQLNIWLSINKQNEQALFTCYAVVKERFPYMARFEGNWATREFIKGICQNARRHCKKTGIKNPTLPSELLEGGDSDGDEVNDDDVGDNPAVSNSNGDDDADDASHEDGNHAPKRALGKTKHSTTKAKAKVKAKQKAKAPPANGKEAEDGEEEVEEVEGVVEEVVEEVVEDENAEDEVEEVIEEVIEDENEEDADEEDGNQDGNQDEDQDEDESEDEEEEEDEENEEEDEDDSGNGQEGEAGEEEQDSDEELD